jgi:hypothetical protein
MSVFTTRSWALAFSPVTYREFDGDMATSIGAARLGDGLISLLGQNREYLQRNRCRSWPLRWEVDVPACRKVLSLHPSRHSFASFTLGYFIYFFNPSVKFVTTVTDGLTCCATRATKIFLPSGVTLKNGTLRIVNRLTRV